MSVSKEIVSYATKRYVFTSLKPFREVVATMEHWLNKEKAGDNYVWNLLLTAKDKEEIESGIAALKEGGRPFVFFSEGSHSRWMNVYFAGEQTFEEAYTFIFGNPMLAKEMMKLNMDTGLYLPPKFFVQEIKGGGTRVLYNPPTAWLGEGVSDELRAVLELAEGLLEEFFKKVLA